VGARIFVVHVQRTGGTSLRWALEATIGAAGVFPSQAELDARPDRRYEPAAEVLRRWPEVRDHRVLVGHYLAAVADRLPVPYRTATFLREPVARSVSIVRLRSRESGRAVADLLADEGFLSGHVADLQTRIFGTVPAGDPERPQESPPADDATLERACARLETFDFVGWTDAYADSITRFDRTFGTTLRRRIRAENASVRDDVPDAEIAEVVGPLVTRDLEFVRRVRGTAR
jgi:hypothetical protein